jgi:outer membrane protein OmpA-like peptidoglycan-associated protein
MIRNVCVPGRFGTVFVKFNRTFDANLVCFAAAWAVGISMLCSVPQMTWAGDRLGVGETLKSIASNWPAAQLAVDMTGLSDGRAIIGTNVQVKYRAALPGFVTYLVVSSHGEMTLLHGSRLDENPSGADTFQASAPLGGEQVLVLFSSKPLDSMLPTRTPTLDVGADRTRAQAFVHQLEELQRGGVLIAWRAYMYEVAAEAGGTQYTTRGIIRQVESAQHGTGESNAKAVIPSRVEFEFDSDRITEQGRRDLDVFGEAMVTRLSGTALMLEGHTDSTGTDQYNLELSRRRAEAARRYLVEGFGLAEAAIATEGRGKADPVAPNDSESNRSKNRRVDFIFSKIAHQ